MKTTRPKAGEKFMAWSFLLSAFPWIATGLSGIAVGCMFLTLGLLFLSSVARRERQWRSEQGD